MHTVLALLGSLSAVAVLACIVWLHWRALRDGFIHDVLLFLTGISILSYVLCRWGRAKSPILGIVGAGAVLAIVVSIASNFDAPLHEPSPEEVVAEVK